MKCQILFSGKNKKKITNLPSAELAQRVTKCNEMHLFPYFAITYLSSVDKRQVLCVFFQCPTFFYFRFYLA